MEQMHDVLGQTRWEPEQFRRLLRLLLSQYDVGTIPPVLDAVQMGPISALRCHEAGHLLVLGAGEGSFPGYSGSKGVLTDQERMALRKLDVHLTGGGEEGIQEEFAEIYGVLCGAERSVRVYCSDEQPSYLFSRLSELCGGPEKADVQLEFAMAGKREAGAWFAQQRLPELAEALARTAGMSCAVCDRDAVIAAAGSAKKDILEKSVSPELEQMMEQRVICERGADSLGEIPLAGRDGYSVVTAAPVITEGDVSGCVAFVSDKEDAASSEVLLSLCQSAAQFLARCAAV